VSAALIDNRGQTRMIEVQKEKKEKFLQWVQNLCVSWWYRCGVQMEGKHCTLAKWRDLQGKFWCFLMADVFVKTWPKYFVCGDPGQTALLFLNQSVITSPL